MKKLEFESKIKELGLDKVYINGLLQVYSTNDKEYYLDNTKNNIYGCFKDKGDFVVYFTDPERNNIEEIGRFKTEDEAYEFLFKYVSNLD